MAEWPGFRTDGINVWAHAKRPGVRPGGVQSQTVRALAERDPSFPRSVLSREKAPHHQAREALKRIARERKRHKVVDATATKQQLQNRALLADGVTNAMVNHHIVAQALRFVPGGRDTFTGLVHRAMLNGDPDAKSWWSVYADLPLQHQARIDFDDVCGVAGVQPDRIMGVVVSTAMRVGNDVGDLVAATMHPSIVHRTTKSAMRIGGEHAGIAQKDREMLFQHHRFIPVPRGVTITAHASAQAAAAAANQPSVPTFAESLDGASAAQTELHRRLAGEVIDADVE